MPHSIRRLAVSLAGMSLLFGVMTPAYAITSTDAKPRGKKSTSVVSTDPVTTPGRKPIRRAIPIAATAPTDKPGDRPVGKKRGVRVPQAEPTPSDGPTVEPKNLDEAQRAINAAIMTEMNARRAAAGAKPLSYESSKRTCMQAEANEQATALRDSGKYPIFSSDCIWHDTYTVIQGTYKDVQAVVDDLEKRPEWMRTFLYPGYSQVGLAVRGEKTAAFGQDRIVVAIHYGWNSMGLPANQYMNSSDDAPGTRPMRVRVGGDLVGTDVMMHDRANGVVRWNVVRGDAPDDGQVSTSSVVAEGRIPAFDNFTMFDGRSTLTSGSLNTNSLGAGRYTFQCWYEGSTSARKYSIDVY